MRLDHGDRPAIRQATLQARDGTGLGSGSASYPWGLWRCQRQASATIVSRSRSTAEAELGLRQSRVVVDGGDITGSPRTHLRRDRQARDPPCGVDHLLDRGSLPSSHVVHPEPVAGVEMLDRSHMGFGHVHDVDVVPHPGAVRRVVVIPVDVHRGQVPHGDVHHDREQIGEEIRGVLAEAARRMRTRRVEVPKGTNRPSTVDRAQIVKDALAHGLGSCIRALGVHGVRLSHGERLRRSVDRPRRTEDDLSHAGAVEDIDEGEEPADVDVVVLQWNVDRLPDRAP